MEILIADDHPLYRTALGLLVKDLADQVTIHNQSSHDEVIDYLQHNPAPDLILVDLHMPGIDPWQGIKTVRDTCPQGPLVIISSSENEEDYAKALEHGALGFIPKSLDSASMLNALRLILDGGVSIAPIIKNPGKTQKLPDNLTPRQYEVLQRLAKGESNKVIARHLELSEGTVKLHVRAVLNALHVSNRTQAVVEAEKMGLLDKE